MAKKSEPLYISPKQFAQHFDVAERTIQGLIAQQSIAATRVGRLWRIPVTEIQRFATENSNKKETAAVSSRGDRKDSGNEQKPGNTNSNTTQAMVAPTTGQPHSE